MTTDIEEVRTPTAELDSIVDQVRTALRDASVAYEPGEDCSAALRRLCRAVVRLVDVVRPLCTSDDPTNHQGDTCPVHEAP